MTIVKEAGISPAIRKLEEYRALTWRLYPTILQYLEDHEPQIYHHVDWCRRNRPMIRVGRNEKEGLFDVLPSGCGYIPFCPMCNLAQANKRVTRAMKACWRAKPKGTPPRYRHIVQTAPIYDWGPHPKRGWGVAASQDVTRFFGLIFEALQMTFGEDIGAVMSYQDIGEEGFKKRHPHMDFTLWGWMFDKGGRPVQTPGIQLQGGGRALWDQRVVALAKELDSEADRGSLDVSQHWFDSNPSYYKVMRYQMREMIDFRKVRYNRAEQTIHWVSYRPPFIRQKFDVVEFQAGFSAYEARLGSFTEGGPRQLHRNYGILAKKRSDDTMERMGGEPLPHGNQCPCSACGDWDILHPDEVDRYYKRHGSDGGPLADK